jgi:hypothetical protein
MLKSKIFACSSLLLFFIFSTRKKFFIQNLSLSECSKQKLQKQIYFSKFTKLCSRKQKIFKKVKNLKAKKRRTKYGKQFF